MDKLIQVIKTRVSCMAIYICVCVYEYICLVVLTFCERAKYKNTYSVANNSSQRTLIISRPCFTFKRFLVWLPYFFTQPASMSLSIISSNVDIEREARQDHWAGKISLFLNASYINKNSFINLHNFSFFAKSSWLFVTWIIYRLLNLLEVTW